MMLKKRSTDKTIKKGPKKQILRRVVEGLFLSNAGPKRGCQSYLTEIRKIYHTSNVSFPIIAIRYDKHPLFGPALDKHNPSTTRRKSMFSFGLKSVDFFLTSYECNCSPRLFYTPWDTSLPNIMAANKILQKLSLNLVIN